MFDGEILAFGCPICDYNAKSMIGLKLHMHTPAN